MNLLMDPFGSMYHRMHSEMSRDLRARSDKEIKQIIAATKNLTMTNCGWGSYAIRSAVADEARHIILSRRAVAKEPTDD